MTSKQLADKIDAVAIGTTHNFADMQALADAAKRFDLHLVYGLNCFYPYLLQQLKGCHTIVGGGIGSSGTGAEGTEVKLYQAKLYQEMGCGEVDLYINIPYIRSGMAEEALKELRILRDAIRCPMKVIVEAPVLNSEQLKSACEVVVASGADFIKTGTGFLGASTLETVRCVKQLVGDRVQIKAAGGIQGIETVSAMLDMGVSRIGMGFLKVVDMLEQMDA